MPDRRLQVPMCNILMQIFSRLLFALVATCAKEHYWLTMCSNDIQITYRGEDASWKSHTAPFNNLFNNMCTNCTINYLMLYYCSSSHWTTQEELGREWKIWPPFVSFVHYKEQCLCNYDQQNLNHTWLLDVCQICMLLKCTVTKVKQRFVLTVFFCYNTNMYTYLCDRDSTPTWNILDSNLRGTETLL